MSANSEIETVRDGPEPEEEDPPTAAHELTGADPLILGRYRLGRRLGAGGFATVHAAHDERLDRQVAIKILPRERVIHSRFQREARAAARLHHPSIVTLFEAAVDDDGAYLVSELVKGSTLDQSLARGELSDRGVLEVAIALGDALEHAHANDVVHRDVKPQNVLVPPRRSRGGGGLAAAKLTDFGVAHVIGADSLTRTGDVIGTLAYMSPEQAEGAQIGPASDLYSLALLVYECLTGVNPVADNIRRGSGRRLGTYLPPLRRQRADLPRPLCGAVDRALRPRPSERGTVAELRIALLESRDLVDDVAGIVADAKPITITRRTERDRGGAAPTRRQRRDADRERPGPAWDDAWGEEQQANPRQRRIPGVVPPADRRADHARLAPAGVLLALGGLIAVGLGFLGLAGAWPALLTQTVRGVWRRALLAVSGFAWIGVAGALTPHDFYYRLEDVRVATLEPAALTALIWAVGSGLEPVLVRGTRPSRDLVLVSLLAAGLAVGVRLTGLEHVDGLVLGAVAGWVLLAHRPLLGLIGESIAARRLP